MKRVTFALMIGASALLQTASVSPQSAVRFPMWDGQETVAEYARRAHVSPTLTLNLGDGVTWEGALVPAGIFVMGSPSGEARTEQESLLETQHRVTISRAFYLGKYELTQAQFEKVMGANPSLTRGSNLPVHNVSWHAGNSGRRPHPVGELMANRFGLYDMHGNIREFVRDYFDGKPLTDAVDPTGPADGDPNNHVVRGGAYTANAAIAGNCRAAIRRPTEVLTITGFRIMVPLPD
jgi:formylglycine-generating enzyme required for sulfatase activity